MIIPAGFAQITHLFGGVAAPTGAAVVYGVSNTAAGTASDVAGFAHDAFSTTLLPILNDDLTLLTTVCKLGPNATGPSAEHNEPIGGGNANPAATPAVAYLLHKATGFGGRRGRGRMYLPGVTEANVDFGGEVTGGIVVDLTDAANEMLGLWNTADEDIVVLHGDATAPYPVFSFSADGMVATQRHRQRR